MTPWELANATDQCLINYFVGCLDLRKGKDVNNTDYSE